MSVEKIKNASFKKGEYVTSKGSPHLGKGKIIDEVDYNQYIVRFDDGDESLFEGSDLVAAHACAKNAKFKVGDRVKDKHGNRGIVIGIQDDDAGPFGPPPSKYGAILRIKTDDGKTGYLDEANAILANSTGVRSSIPAVNAALNGCGTAKNAAADIPNGAFGKVTKALEKMREESMVLLGQLRDWGANVNGSEVSLLIQKIVQQARNRLFG